MAGRLKQPRRWLQDFTLNRMTGASAGFVWGVFLVLCQMYAFPISTSSGYKALLIGLAMLSGFLTGWLSEHNPTTVRLYDLREDCERCNPKEDHA